MICHFITCGRRSKEVRSCRGRVFLIAHTGEAPFPGTRTEVDPSQAIPPGYGGAVPWCFDALAAMVNFKPVHRLLTGRVDSDQSSHSVR